MIGSYFKKLAKQNNMNVKNGVAYGKFQGFSVTFRDGNNRKFIDVATRFPSLDEKSAFMEELGRIDLMKQYSVLDIHYYDDCIEVVFYDTLGTWKKLLSFVDYFFPLLRRYGASDVYHCVKCGELISDAGTWQLIDNVAYHLHKECAIDAHTQVQVEQQEPEEVKSGSFLSGALGAIVAAIISAVPIAALRYFGYPGYVIGILTGFLAYKGYMLCNGKNARGKGIIVILCSLIGIILGAFASDAVYMFIAIKNGQLAPMSTKDILPGILYLLSTNEEYASDCDVSIMLLLFMAIAGMFPIFKNNRRRRKTKIITLE